MKINKYNKLVCNLHDKNNYVIHARALKQALDNGLILKKVYRAIEFNQEVWLKEYIGMTTKLRTEAKNEFQDFSKLRNNFVFGKTMENVQKHRYLKLVATDKKKKSINFRT